MSQDMYRLMMEDAHLLSDNFKMTHIDDCFVKCQEVLASRTEGKGRRDVSGSTWLSLQEFFVVLCWVAHSKFGPGMDSLSLDAQLSVKLSNLITNYLFPNLGSAITERLRALEGSITSYTATLLKKGRRLTEQTLDSCQVKSRIHHQKTVYINASTIR